MSQNLSMSKPPRRRIGGLWWKIPIGLIVGLAIVGYLAHTIWLGVEKRKADGQIAAIRAAGEPVAWADFAEENVPGAENLAVPIRAALAAFHRSGDATMRLMARRSDLLSNDGSAFAVPLTEDETIHLRDQAKELSTTLAALDGMIGRSRVSWGPVGTSSGGGMTYDPDMSELTEFRRLLRDDALLAIHERRWADAARRLERLRLFCGAVAARSGSNSAMFGLDEADLAIAFAAAKPDAGVRDATRAMIAEHLDDAAVSRRFRLGLRQTRVQVIEATGMIRGGSFAGVAPPITARIALRAVAPLIYRSEAAMLELLTASLAVGDVASAPEFDAKSGPLKAIERAVGKDRLALADLFLTSSQGEERFDELFDHLGERHLAAAALAIRLYGLDHAGRRPPTLDALVPDYLPAVPIDPWDAKPIRYDAAAGKLWSVGRDRTDQQGDATATASYERGLWGPPDAVVFLDPQPRPAPSTRSAPTTAEEP